MKSSKKIANRTVKSRKKTKKYHNVLYKMETFLYNKGGGNAYEVFN